MVATIYDDLFERFPDQSTPDWHTNAIRELRRSKDRGRFGLYLYHLIREDESINRVLNIGTARGYSAVCAAKALRDEGREGAVDTIDNRDPDTQLPTGDHETSDRTRSVREFIGLFLDPESESVPIRHHTGDSSEILADWEGKKPDLAFHDASHTYGYVTNDVDHINSLKGTNPIHVFDDCYLYSSESEWKVLTPTQLRQFESIPKIRGLIKILRKFTLEKDPFPGVTLAVEKIVESGEWSVEIVSDSDHAPITAIFPYDDPTR
ncbi:class I SAM-dependent methyltransferase [Halorubrum sp. AD140]|uniref:class I SAM-dependent methyltransferase n=1 Tax=Halorubrum sp. AD140 TaxID=3050073 RepID=UPI002ACC689B|nr:class I SAM-dependent methyltransferase [Halorubrum sp. AD140]MDZ5810489.1 class I SAM-dependent methyltransferase [Halorubrum sp. AD140]